MFGLPRLGCYINDMEEQVVYEINFGEESHGEVRLINGNYSCFVTPQYGGYFEQVGEEYEDVQKAIKYIKSLA